MWLMLHVSQPVFTLCARAQCASMCIYTEDIFLAVNNYYELSECIPCTKTLNASISVPSSATLLATQVYLVLLSLKMVALMVSVRSTISNSLGRAMMVGSLKLTLGSRVEFNIDPSLSHWMEGAGTPVAVHVKVRVSVTLTI